MTAPKQELEPANIEKHFRTLPLCGFLGQQGQQATAFVDAVGEMMERVGNRLGDREAESGSLHRAHDGALVISDHSTPLWKQLSSTADSNESACPE